MEFWAANVGASMDDQPEWLEAGEFLRLAMRRMGLSAPALSKRSDGEVSASAIRSYQNGNRPRPRKMMALALAVGPENGGELMRLFGYDEMLESVRWFGTRMQTHSNQTIRPEPVVVGIKVFDPEVAVEEPSGDPVLLRGSTGAASTASGHLTVAHKLEVEYGGEPLSTAQQQAVAAFIKWLQASDD
ncbi:MAG: helix-turn-helix transcriptional regulator [Acidimicrobiia bacterium]